MLQFAWRLRLDFARFFAARLRRAGNTTQLHVYVRLAAGLSKLQKRVLLRGLRDVAEHLLNIARGDIFVTLRELPGLDSSAAGGPRAGHLSAHITAFLRLERAPEQRRKLLKGWTNLIETQFNIARQDIHIVFPDIQPGDLARSKMPARRPEVPGLVRLPASYRRR